MFYAALVAGGLCLLSVLSLVALRPSGSALSRAAAALVLRTRFGPLTALLFLAGSVPLAGLIAAERTFAGPSPLAFALALVVAAAGTALGLLGVARVIAAFARRVYVAVEAAFRRIVLASHGAIARTALGLQLSLGVRLARRRPSRGPPALL